MRRYGVAFLGFGNVAKALARLLDAKRSELAVRYGISCHATGVASRSLGWWANPDGLTLSAPDAGTRCYDLGDWLLTARPDVVFESISLDPHTGQPALDYLAETLRAGIHAVSANKGPVVYGYQRLAALAESHGKLYRFESAVMDGAPVFSLARRGIPLAGIRGVSGIFTSTATVVLEAIERGRSIEEGIREAQALGIAETDPAYDVDGWDTAVKLCAISNVILECALRPGEVQREGIRNLDPAAVRAAQHEGRPYRLVGRVSVEGNDVSARVSPEQVDARSPLAVSGPTLVMHYDAAVFPGGLTVTSSGPDLTTTAYGMFTDFLECLGAT